MDGRHRSAGSAASARLRGEASSRGDRATGHTPQANAYAQIEATLPYATHSHIRDVFENGQAVDLDRVWPLFARANYKGFMSAEYEGEEDPSTGVPKLVEKIKTLCRKYSSV